MKNEIANDLFGPPLNHSDYRNNDAVKMLIILALGIMAGVLISNQIKNKMETETLNNF